MLMHSTGASCLCLYVNSSSHQDISSWKIDHLKIIYIVLINVPPCSPEFIFHSIKVESAVGQNNHNHYFQISIIILINLLIAKTKPTISPKISLMVLLEQVNPAANYWASKFDPIQVALKGPWGKCPFCSVLLLECWCWWVSSGWRVGSEAEIQNADILIHWWLSHNVSRLRHIAAKRTDRNNQAAAIDCSWPSLNIS